MVLGRIRENAGRGGFESVAHLVNRSIDETLGRTILTSLTTLLAAVALLALGGEALRGFSAATAVGILAGPYSTIFIAAPAARPRSPRMRP